MQAKTCPRREASKNFSRWESVPVQDLLMRQIALFVEVMILSGSLMKVGKRSSDTLFRLKIVRKLEIQRQR
jgi:hypothetical protein